MKRCINANTLTKSQIYRMSVADRVQLAESDPSLAVLRILAHDPSYKVRRAVARECKFDRDIEITERLTRDKDSFVRSIIGQSTKDPEIRSRLLQDPDSNVRYLVLKASHLYGQVENCIDVIRGLVNDPNPQVRRYLAHIAVWYDELQDLLDILADDADPRVRQEAEDGLDELIQEEKIDEEIY